MPERPEGPSGPLSGRQGRGGQGRPSALPPAKARAVAFAAILVAGLCGLLIGRALVDIQCDGDCSVASGLGGAAGGIVAAAGVAVVAVLVLRAMGEWRARGLGEKRGGTRP